MHMRTHEHASCTCLMRMRTHEHVLMKRALFVRYLLPPFAKKSGAKIPPSSDTYVYTNKPNTSDMVTKMTPDIACEYHTHGHTTD